MIVVLSLNTAIDRTEVVPGFRAGGVFRAGRSLPFAGGKGLNVARAVRRLGEPVRVVGFLGGAPSGCIRRACTELGIDQRWVEIGGETRSCTIVVDPESGEQTVINEPGPMIGAAELDGMRGALSTAVEAGDTVCLSGSAPAGVPLDLYAEIVRTAKDRGGRVLVDCTGPALRMAWEAGPWSMTPNEQEAEATFGLHGGAVEAALALSANSDHVLFTLGARGALYAQGGRVWTVAAPNIRVVNAVGSGDAFAAGWLVGMQRDLEPLQALRLAVTCGAANAARLEPDIGAWEDVRSLLRLTPEPAEG